MLHGPADRQISGEYIDFLRIVYHQMVRNGPFLPIFGNTWITSAPWRLKGFLRHDCDFHPYALDFVSL
jgi:hypothetical protein